MADNGRIIERLKERFPEEILDVSDRPGDLAVKIDKKKLVEICTFLRDDPELSFKYFIDICGVDYLHQGKTPRFACVYHFFSLEKNHRIRLKVLLDETDLTLDSVVGVWKGAEWFEREAYDLFGFEFQGHPFLRRILTHHQFVGHALRKDYEHGKRQLCTEVWDLEFD